MSTVLHTAPPPQPRALGTPPLISTTSSSHHYASTRSSPSREVYNANQHNGAASPSSSRQTSRSRIGNGSGSGNGNGVGASNSSLQLNQSLAAGQNSPMTSRAALASPVPVAAPSLDHHSSATSERRRNNMPPVAPPRTSSTNHNGGSAASGNSRRPAAPNDRATASPRHGDNSNSRAITNGDIDGPGMEDARTSTSSRRRHQQMAQEPPERSSSTRDGRTGGVATIPIRTAAQPNSAMRQDANEAADATRHEANDDTAPPPVVGMGEHTEQSRRGGRSRHDPRSGRRDKNTKFGEYVLGNVIGEGEFGKVRLGWKQDDGVQVAIKIIKKESLGNNPTRLSKIHREVNILRGLSHPNIVHLHDMIGDDTRIGIVLEYASGGELFDYILNHRYLKDHAARRLFAQLISGVGYLHKKGIVHRDLKLENLLLDRNRNIIITDFGFANMFDPKDELNEEEELNLSDREFVKRFGLDKVKGNGTRRGDLMQTSCGSPCYAAPELVVSDSLYTGRKVDVWSCGVILYAMLAGYLPFDDDPANPEGDNINLLYKYIVNTPLTFPEYVSPHARDLLRRILVPNPRRRADLFEVARHSWLSEYASVVRVITSSTTTPTEIQNTTVPAEGYGDEASGVARSASVREAAKSKTTSPPAVGGLTKQGHIDAEEAAIARAQKEAKRRTVQVEYVAPTTQTQRGEYVVTSGGKTRARSGSQGPVEVGPTGSTSPNDKPLPRDPPVSKDAYSKSSTSRQAPSAHRNQNAPTSRPSRDTRAISDGVYMTSATGGARPQTGGSMQSSGSMGLGNSGRGGYGQPAPPAVAGTNVHGRIQQPSAGDGQDPRGVGRSNVPNKFAQVTGFEGKGQSHSGPPSGPPSADIKGHKRSSTIGDIGSKIMGRSGSLFGRRKRSEAPGDKSKKYPPISMNNQMGSDEPRQSIDSRHSRRSFSLGLGKKRSGSINESNHSQEKQTRRFSLIPASFSLKAIGLGKEDPPERYSQPDLPIQDARSPTTSSRQPRGRTPIYDAMHRDDEYQSGPENSPVQQRYPPGQYDKQPPNAVPPYMQQSVLNTGSESSVDMHRRQPGGAPYQGGFSESEGYDGRRVGQKNGNRVLQKNKRFADAYDEEYRGHEGSSGAAKRVMDFFRRRGRARGGEDR